MSSTGARSSGGTRKALAPRALVAGPALSREEEGDSPWNPPGQRGEETAPPDLHHRASYQGFPDGPWWRLRQRRPAPDPSGSPPGRANHKPRPWDGLSLQETPHITVGSKNHDHR